MDKLKMKNRFFNLYSHDFARVAVGVPRCRVADRTKSKFVVFAHAANSKIPAAPCREITLMLPSKQETEAEPTTERSTLAVVCCS